MPPFKKIPLVGLITRMFMTLLRCWLQLDVDYLYLGTRLGLMKKFIGPEHIVYMSQVDIHYC